MDHDKALALLEKQLAAGRIDTAVLTFRTMATDARSLGPGQKARLDELLRQHECEPAVRTLLALALLGGLTGIRDAEEAMRRLDELAELGEPHACLHLALRHLVDERGSLASEKEKDLKRLAPAVAAKVGIAADLAKVLDFDPIGPALLSRSPALSIHSSFRSWEAALERIRAKGERDFAKQEALKAKWS